MPASTEKLFDEFAPASKAEWEAALAKDLKGKEASALAWKTEDGITVQPFYTAEDLVAPLEIPARVEPGWRVRYEITEAAPVDANAAAKRALEHGAQEIVFTGVRLDTAADVLALIAGLDVPVDLRFGSDAGRVLALLLSSGVENLRGSIDYDPVAEAHPVDTYLVRRALLRWPEFLPVGVRAEAWHHAGATTAQELAFTLASGVYYLNELGPEVARSMVFGFAIGPHYFTEIAKFRAARVLWAQVLEAYGVQVRMNLFTRTGRWNKSVYDPYNNLLRATTEAMSAAIGGADAITVGAFDETYRHADDFSRHLALNTQLILRDEAFMDKVDDPAAGSWFIESLTRSLAEAAWAIFQKVEAEGGMLRAAREGGLAEQAILQAREARDATIATRRRVFVGVNQYPNVREAMLDRIEREPTYVRGPWPFEEVRLDTEKFARKIGRTPSVLLLSFGDLKMRRARADFVSNFFGAGGFAISEPPAFASAEEAARYAAQAGADLVVLCSSDPEYPSLAGPVCEALRAGGVNTPVLVAGNPKEAARLREAGVADFVHIKSHPLDTLRLWQRRLGVIQ